MNDSFANVFWIRFGERSGPEKNGSRPEWVIIRWLLMM